jgi:phosphomevalonate kinase
MEKGKLEAKEATCSAPGKIFWIGAYAILHKGNLAHVLAVDKRIKAKARKENENKITVYVPQFNIKVHGFFDKENKLVKFQNLSNEEENKIKFVKAAIETTFKYLTSKGKEVKGLTLTTTHDPAFAPIGDLKTGLGSSAAVTVATIAAIMSLYGYDINKDEDKEVIHKLSQYSHSIAQGKVGSGFDIATACYGCIKYERYSPEIINGELPDVIDKPWDYVIEKVPFPKKFLVLLAFTGKSASTTEMVKKVMAYSKQYQEEYNKLIKEMNEKNKEAINYLIELNRHFDNKTLENFRNAFEEGRMLLKKLGELSNAEIESDNYSSLIEEIKKRGAFLAKLPGAGGGDSLFVVCLDEKSRKNVGHFLKEKGLILLDVKISDEGVRKEE